MTSTAGIRVAGRMRARVARPARDLAASTAFYVGAIGLERLGGFVDHAGYDGGLLGIPGADWHLELARHRSGLPAPAPTDEDLLVLHLQADEVAAAAARLRVAGHPAVAHANPYRAAAGAVVVTDPDGYGLVLCPGAA